MDIADLKSHNVRLYERDLTLFTEAPHVNGAVVRCHGQVAVVRRDNECACSLVKRHVTFRKLRRLDVHFVDTATCVSSEEGRISESIQATASDEAKSKLKPPFLPCVPSVQPTHTPLLLQTCTPAHRHTIYSRLLTLTHLLTLYILPLHSHLTHYHPRVSTHV